MQMERLAILFFVEVLEQYYSEFRADTIANIGYSDYRVERSPLDSPLSRHRSV